MYLTSKKLLVIHFNIKYVKFVIYTNMLNLLNYRRLQRILRRRLLLPYYVHFRNW